MNVIVYHGALESRETIRDFEFYFSDAQTNAQTRGLHKFHVLITSYETIKQDLNELRKVPWRYMVVDEAHRLKNKDSALAQDLRTLRVEHLHLLSGTPLQNNTTELWSLLSFLDAQLFPSLDAFLADFGTLTEAAQARFPHSHGASTARAQCAACVLGEVEPRGALSRAGGAFEREDPAVPAPPAEE